MRLWSWVAGRVKVAPPQSDREIAERDEEVAAVLDEFATVDAHAQHDIRSVRHDLDDLREEMRVRQRPSWESLAGVSNGEGD